MKITDKIFQYLEDPLHSFKSLQKIIAVVCIAIPLVFRCCDRDDFCQVKPNSQALARINNSGTAIGVETVLKKYLVGTDSQLIIKDTLAGDTIATLIKIKKDRWGVRASLSDYAYSSNSYLFGMLYCMAAMLFIYNGVVYLKTFNNRQRYKRLNLSKKGPYYNIIIGLCLIMVVLNPMHDCEILHYIFSVAFFLGNILVLAFIPNKDADNASKLKRRVGAALAAGAIIVSLFGYIPILWGEWISLAIISTHLFLVAGSADLKKG